MDNDTAVMEFVSISAVYLAALKSRILALERSRFVEHVQDKHPKR